MDNFVRDNSCMTITGEIQKNMGCMRITGGYTNTNGNIMDRIHNTLMINNAIKQDKSAVNIPIFIIILITVILICILVCDYLFF